MKVTITQNSDGTVTIKLEQLVAAGNYLGDLRGLFFDLADVTLIGSLTTANSAAITELQQGNDTVKDLGNGANMQGLLGDSGGYDVGVEFGTAGIGSKGDDIRGVSFTLDSSLRDLTLADFANVTFGVRLTSVGQDINGDGTIDTSRNGSAKIGENTFTLLTTLNDSTCVLEDATNTGNIFGNDTSSATFDTLSVTSWSGGAIGSPVAIAGGQGATVRLNANGSWTVDATAANALASGQEVSQSFTVTVLQTRWADAAKTIPDGTYSTTETFTVTIKGVNDDVTISAGTDAAGAVTEDSASPTLSDTGTILFDDLDLTDVHTASVVAVSNTLGGALALGTVSEDAANGTGSGSVGWTYTVANSATQYLAQNQTATESFTVTIDDQNGDTVDQLVTVTVTGVNDGPVLAGAVTDILTTFEDVNFGAGWGYVNATTQVSGGSWDTDNPDNQIEVGAGGVYGVGGASQVNELEANPGNAANLFTDLVVQAGNSYALSVDYSPRSGVPDSGVNVFWGGNLIGTMTGAVTGMAPFNFTLGVPADGTYRLEFKAAENSNALGGLIDNIKVQHTIGTGGTVTEMLIPVGDLTTGGSVGFSDVDLADVHIASASAIGTTLGTVTASIGPDTTGIGTGGEIDWSYKVSAAAVEYLGAGDTLVERFTIAVNDQQGGVVSRTVSVTVIGTNDAASFSGNTAGAVKEDTTLNVIGALVVTDADLGESTIQAQTNTAGTYGSFSINTAGAWSYSLNNAAAVVQNLKTADSKLDQFTVKSADGTTQQVTITVGGLDDGATLPSAYTGPLADPLYDAQTFGGKADSFADDGNNLLVGTSGPNSISGLLGNDRIHG